MEWERQRFAGKKCGYCGDPIEVGAAVLVLRFGRRCQNCALRYSTQPPANFPELPEPSVLRPVPPPLRIPTQIASRLPLDWQRAASGEREREPGEDDD